MHEQNQGRVEGYSTPPDPAVRRVMQDEYRMRFSSMEDEIHKNIMTMSQALMCDPRWMSIGITHIQEGFMALKRAMYEGKRVGDP